MTRHRRAYLALVAAVCAAESSALWWATSTGRLRLSLWQLLGIALAGALLCDLLSQLAIRRRPSRRRAHARPTTRRTSVTERATETTDIRGERPAFRAPARWARGYFTTPRAQAAYLRRVANRTGKGRR